MKKLAGVISAALFVLAITALPVLATVQTGGQIVVKKGEIINDDFFAAGDEVTIEGTVNGDVYAGAQRVNIRGRVNGDVIAGANTIEVTGVIRDDLRAGGNTISLIGATVGDSVSVGGNELSIDSDSKVGGAVIFGGRSLSLSGSVGRGITSGAESVRVDALVGRTVRIAANNITIDDNAVIKGDLEYNSDNEPTINGKVTGQVIKGEGKGPNVNTEVFLKRVAVGFTVWAAIAAAIVGGVLMLIWPKVFKKADEELGKRPWPTIGWGALVWLTAIPLAVVLMITVFGIPLALLVITAWVVAIYLAKLFVAYALGNRLWRSFHDKTAKINGYVALLLGLVIYYLLRSLPYIGVPIRIATTIVGLGMILSLMSRRSGESKA